jgi:hypothetical protein
MSAKQYVVSLTATERAQLERAARSNKRSRRERVRARLLLGVDSAGGAVRAGATRRPVNARAPASTRWPGCVSALLARVA